MAVHFSVAQRDRCSSQPSPEQIELSFLDVKRTLVPTNDGATYFTLPTERRVRRAQGVYPPPSGEPPSIETYVC